MVKFLSMMLAVSMVFSFVCGTAMAMAKDQTPKEAGEKVVNASKDAGKGIGKGAVATGKAVGQTVLNTGTAVVDIGKTVVEQTGSILKPVATLGKDASTELEKGAKETDEKK